MAESLTASACAHTMQRLLLVRKGIHGVYMHMTSKIKTKTENINKKQIYKQTK